MRTITPIWLPYDEENVVNVPESAVIRHAAYINDGIWIYAECEANDGALVDRTFRVIQSGAELSGEARYVASCDTRNGMRHIYLIPPGGSGLTLSEEAEAAYQTLRADGFFIDNDSRQFGPGENDIAAERSAEQTIAIAELELAGFVYHDPAE